MKWVKYCFAVLIGAAIGAYLMVLTPSKPSEAGSTIYMDSAKSGMGDPMKVTIRGSKIIGFSCIVADKAVCYVASQ